MKEQDKTNIKAIEKTEKNEEKNKTVENTIISDELIRWMTEPTNPNMIPRADNG